MKSITEEIEELRRMNVVQLVERYQELWGREPRCRNREHLWRRCAWKLQEQRFGGLPGVAKDRLEELVAEIDLPLAESQRTVTGELKRPRRPSDPPVGTVLVRQWRGLEIRVQVVDDGYEHGGVVYSTLSAVAKGITGAHWNGRLFFGFTQRRKSK